MHGNIDLVRPGGPSQFIPPPGESLARLSRRVLSPGQRFALRVLSADLGNFFFVQHRHVDGFIVTAKNGGSHWLKFMLSVGLAQLHGLPPPAFSTGRAADEIIGHPSRKRRLPGVPLIGTSHTIPSALHRFVPSALARRPPIVVMVRNIEPAMRSNYVKWHAQYETRHARGGAAGAPSAASALSAFAQGDPGGRQFVADAWWYVHFFNRWGDWAEADPARIMLVRYEDLVADPAVWLPRIAAHLNLGFDAAAIKAALAFAGKDAIAARQDPNAGEVIVPDPRAAPRIAFGTEDRHAIGKILRRHLRHDFGYPDLPARRPKTRR